MIEANPTSFQPEVIEASHDQPVLVLFSAAWCAPCGVLGPIMERIGRGAAGAFKLVKVDADEAPALMQAWAVRSLPTVVAFRGGKAVDRFVGAIPEPAVRAFVARLAPRPGEDLLAQARNLIALADWPRAAEVLRTVLALNPALDAARVHYVRALLQIGEGSRARLAFEPLRARARTDLGLSALAASIDAAEATASVDEEGSLLAALDASPRDPAAWLRLAQWRLARGAWRPAMEAFLELVRVDRHHGEEAGRRGLLAAFELCDDPALVREFRRRLSAGLH